MEGYSEQDGPGSVTRQEQEHALLFSPLDLLLINILIVFMSIVVFSTPLETTHIDAFLYL